MASNLTNNRSDTQFEQPDIKGDRLNAVLLIILYTLQSSVAGLTSAISFVLQRRNVSYQDQAEFSIVSYPYTFKILWAPIVDSIYLKCMGRRKTWLIPAQYFIGFLLLLVSLNVDNWLGSEDGSRKPNVRNLTVVFFMCVFFASTQDIAVDAWSLTIFQKRNIGYSATCQSIGFAFGYFLGFVGFIVLESKDFCNRFRSFPQDRGFVTFSEFIFYWAIAFFVISSAVLVLKKEGTGVDGNEHVKANVIQTYVLLWRVLKIRPIQFVILFLSTCFIGFGPTRSVAPLKLLDAGVSRDVLALLTVPSLPFQLFLPILLGRTLTGPRPMRIFLVFYLLKLMNNVFYGSYIYLVFQSKNENNVLPEWYYWPLVLISNFDTVAVSTIVMAMQAFFARISDPQFGGVYMTLLMCISNLGYQWNSTVCLWLVDALTVKSCDLVESKCHTIFDGFFGELIICTLFGVLWFTWGRRQIINLEKLDSSAYTVKQKSAITVEDHGLSLTCINSNENDNSLI